MSLPSRTFTLTLVWLSISAHRVHPQSVTTAAIYGTVTGGDSLPIEEAAVTVINTANGERWQTVTRARGRYFTQYLSLGGPYTVEARAIGYEPTRRSGIVLSLGERLEVDFRLTPTVVTLTELAVTAAVDPLINAGRTGPAQTITDTLSSRLPVRSRDFAQLVYLSPQAVQTPSGGVSIAGQNDRLNGFQIDGAINGDQSGFSGGGGFGTPAAQAGIRTLSVEAVKELQVLSAPFDVRFGTFAGGLVNAVTRSGSNRLEGSLSAYLEDQALTGRDTLGNRAQDFRNKELALTLAGPIVRDRAAFFLDAGLQRDVVPQTVPAIRRNSPGPGISYASAVRFQQILRDSNGVEAGTFAVAPARAPSGNLLAKITLQPAVNHRVEVSHNYGHGNPDFIDRGCLGCSYSLSSNFAHIPATTNATRLTWAMTSGGGVSNELNLAHLRVREGCHPASLYPQVVVAADSGFLVAGTHEFCQVNYANQDISEVTDNVSWFTGTHQLTLGTHDELLHLKRNTLIQPLGSWFFSSLDALAARLPDGYSRTVVNPLRPAGPVSDYRVGQVGFYVQDQWTPTPRVTLTAGVRLDVPFLPSAPARNSALQSALGIDNTRTPSGNTLWSPRLGFSYALGSLGFLRGGVGLFAGRPAFHWFNAVYYHTGLDAFELDCTAPNVPAFTLDPASQPTTCLGGGLGGSAPDVNYFNPSFRFPRNLRVSIGTDLRLPRGVVATLDLLYIRGVNQFYLTDVNLNPPTATAAGEGGRLLYGSIDPATGDAAPDRRSPAFGPVLEVRNASGDRSISGSVQLQKRFADGAEIGLAYTYTDAKDRLSAIADVPYFNVGGDVNPLDGSLDQRRLTTSLYSVPHKITFVAAMDLPLRTRFSLFYNGFSGPPYAYRVQGDANADGITSSSGNINDDLIYVPRDSSDITLEDPTQYAALDSLIRGQSCLLEQRGRVMRRNSCRDPWVTLLNARVSRVFPTVHGRSVELMADLFNVLSFLDRDWGVRRSIAFSDTRLLQLVGYDQAGGRGIYSLLPQDPKAIDTEGTRWRLQLGARYTF